MSKDRNGDLSETKLSGITIAELLIILNGNMKIESTLYEGTEITIWFQNTTKLN